tara:strand:- start:2976 stop:4409 length:1434 start_codon:yes stop_codon:yes gene_type:complete
LRKLLRETEFDLIVIGGGTAGIPIAICAADRGANVLIVEKAHQVGGTLFMSHGEMAAANTVFQKAQNIDDSSQLFYDDIMRINKGTSDPALTRLWADYGGETIDWLAKNGFKTAQGTPVRGKSYDPFETARYLWGDAQGISILNVLQPMLARHVGRGNIKVLVSTEVTDLIRDRAGEVRGIVAKSDDGVRLDLKGRNTVIATGGCAANPSMYENLHGVPLYSRLAYPYSQGDGLTLGLSADGFLRGAENYISSFGSVTADNRIPSALYATLDLNSTERLPWEVFVNAAGKRFVQEDHPSVGHRARALDRQPGHRCWVIFDQSVLEQAPSILPKWPKDRIEQEFHSHPMFFRAASLAELGGKAGIHPANLRQSIENYNSGIRRRNPDQFGRVHRPSMINSPPFYAIQSQGWTLKSFAGLAVDRNLQVLSTTGKPIGNLYAAGEVLGGGSTGGKAFTNGSNVTPALTFGRLLGRKILVF